MKNHKSKKATGRKNDLSNELWSTTWTYVKTVVDTAREPFLILDKNLRVAAANETFYQLFKVSRSETEDKYIYDIGNKQWNIPSLKKLLEEIVPRDTFFKDFEVDHVFPVVGRKIILLNARQIFGAQDRALPQLILLAMEDTTIRILAERKMEEYTQRLEEAVEKRTIQLEVRVRELEKITKIIAERESKIIELRKQVSELKQRLKK
ncbi:MAG: PAS domain-containing protein [Patescibacteria group bacterium]|nr:PAS domain-containing protein [Patescibacteria group bacterium]